MNLITLGKDVRHVCMRYRIEPVRAALRTEGHWFSVEAMPATFWRRWPLYRELKRTSVVVVQRRLLSPWETSMLRRACKHLIFDFDDAFFQKNSLHENASSPRRLARFQAMVQAADQVFAGNSYLAEIAGQLTDPGKVTVMPTCVDVDKYPRASHSRRDAGVRLAWIGSASTLRVFARQRKLWTAIQQALPGVEWRLLCDRFPQWPEVNIVPIPWASDTEAAQLAACDIGIAWLPDDAWSRGKCALKVLQYHAAGLPVVTSPVGVNRELVVPGQNGLWAATAGEWIDAVRQLAIDPALRQRMGQQGRRQVEEHYSTSRLVQRWKAALRLDHLERRRNAA